jgi:small subunit ribosomal protein S8
MVSDPIGDFLTRLRNSLERHHEVVTMPSTKMLVSIAKILKDENFILDFEVEEKEPQNELTIKLKYVNNEPVIRELVRVSKPGIRRYRGYKEIKPIMNGLGLSIYSTPSGVITGEQAIKEKVGGEYLCYIY